MRSFRHRSSPSGRSCVAAATDGAATIVGIKPWKRWQIDRFLAPRYRRLHYRGNTEAALRCQARHGGPVIVWAGREPADLATAARARGAPLIRMEDGFLRSAGLGSNHVGGASLVLDERGIHFDPRTPSDLEVLLETADFDAVLLQRAARLRQRLIDTGLSKYNVGRRAAASIGAARGQLRLLVPGQVEDDASLRLGASGPDSNRALLHAVRAAYPRAWIVYKPHPDTEAGTRGGAIPDAEALNWADYVVRDVAITALLPQIDEVHTMTSLTGFEALLRGVAVCTWGRPFYAGWGLSHDHAALPRRTRRRSIDELVAAALIRYPLYVDPASGEPCEAETVVEWLARRRAASADPSALHRGLRLCRGWLRSGGWRR